MKIYGTTLDGKPLICTMPDWFYFIRCSYLFPRFTNKYHAIEVFEFLQPFFYQRNIIAEFHKMLELMRNKKMKSFCLMKVSLHAIKDRQID